MFLTEDAKITWNILVRGKRAYFSEKEKKKKQSCTFLFEQEHKDTRQQRLEVLSTIEKVK